MLGAEEKCRTKASAKDINKDGVKRILDCDQPSIMDGSLLTNTWLILPVVICLSQRLSHACLSISRIWLSREWLITTALVYWILESYMDNCGNSRANTRKETLTLRAGCIY